MMIEFTPEKVRTLRKDLRMTQAEFGTAVGISTGLVGAIETKAKPITAETNRKLNDLLRLADYLIGDSWNTYRTAVAEIERMAEQGARKLLSELPVQTLVYVHEYYDQK